MTFLFSAHSGFRWLVVLIGVIALVQMILSILGTAASAKRERMLMLVFTISLDIQVTLGIVLLIFDRIAQGAPFTPFIGHVVTLLIALIAGHIFYSRGKKAGEGAQARFYLMGIIVALVLIFLGVIALPGGMARWGMAS